jgi:hypothetical protein
MMWPARFGPSSPLARSIRRAAALAAPIAALALMAAPARADQNYPSGLFENSPVVPHGGTFDGAPGADTQGPAGPDEGGMAGPPDPDVAGSPVAAAPGPIADYCASMPYRTFSSLAEVKRAHARCDRFRGQPPQGPAQ